MTYITCRLQKFKKSALLAHERDINKLQDEGDRLVEARHPASAAIKARLSTASHCQNSYDELRQNEKKKCGNLF